MSCYRFLYLIKLPGCAPLRRARFPAPLRRRSCLRPAPAGCADARPHVDRAGGYESITAPRPAGQNNASGGGSAGTGMEGAPLPTAGP